LNDSQGKAHLWQWFYLLSNIPATLKIEVKQKHIKLEPGDFIQITRPSLPDLTAGTKGWTDVKGLITGQRFSLKSAIQYDVFVWDLYTRVTNGFTINSTTVTDDTDVAFSATNDATLEAADGFHDFTNIAFDWCIFTVTIAKPNEGAPGSNETISLAFHIQNPTGTDIHTETRRYIQYFTEDSDTITYKFILIPFTGGNLGVSGIDRVKVDWYERSTATAAKQPTITFTTFQHGTFDNTLSIP